MKELGRILESYGKNILLTKSMSEARRVKLQTTTNTRSAIIAWHNQKLDKIVRHLEDLGLTGDIGINSGITWKSIIDMHRIEDV